MAITIAQIKELRDITGIGMEKCKRALEEANGNIELAITNLRKAGLASAAKKEGREAKEGIILSGASDKGVAIVEINTETDFVAKNERFQDFAQNIATEIAHLQPSSVEELSGLKYSQDGAMTIDEYRASLVQSLGENIQIKRFEIFPAADNQSIGLYSHMGGKSFGVVELIGSSQSEDLAKEIAMHAVAEAPSYLSPETVPASVMKNEEEIAREQVKGKPPEVTEKIVQGKIQAFLDDNCLLRQKFIKDPGKTIEQLLKEKGSLKLKRFARWSVGE